MSIDPYGTIRAKVIDLQGNSTGGAVSNNDWRLVVDNEQLKFQHYDPTANNANGAYITRQSFGTGLTGISVVPLGTYSITGNLQVTDDLTVDGGTLFVDASTNRVGFGTLTPSQVVHIVGNAYVDGDLTVTGNASLSSSSVWTKDGSTNEVTYTAANVGIGTNNPDSTLHVNGTTKLVGDVTMQGHIIPSAANTYDLGSAAKTFRHVYVGPGSLYVNGKQVITDDSDTITITTDINQNLALKTSGSGNMQISTVGTGDIELTAGGIIQMKKTLQILDGQKITSSGATTVVCGNNFQSEGSLRGTSLTLDGSNSISAAELNVLDGVTGGTATASKAVVLDVNKDITGIRDMVLAGNLTVSGTTTTVNSTTVAVADGMFKYASTNTSNATDFGWYGKYVDSSVTYFSGMFRDATDNKMRFFTSTQVEPTTTVDTTGTGYTKADIIVGDVDFTSGTMRGHILPDVNDAYDIGSAEFKIRDIYVSDNSLWVGDNHKITIDGTTGKMKFRKRRTSTMPPAVTSAGGTASAALSHSGKGSLAEMKLKHWKAYMRTLSGQANAKVKDIFRATADDYEEEQGADTWLENGDNIYLGHSGNVGIGDSTPSYKLDVTGDINFTGTLRQNGSAYSSGAFTVSNSEAYYMGNVGIGTNNPVAPLHLSTGSSSGNHLYMTNDATGNTASDGFRIGLDANNHVYIYQNEAKNMRFGTNQNERMTILSNGNIGINDTTPSYTLDVTGDINFTGTLRKNGTEYGGGGSSVWSTSGSTATYANKVEINKSDSDGLLTLTAGQGAGASTANQIRLGYNGGKNYMHSIKTNHHGSQDAGNSIHFYVWNQGTDAQTANPTKKVFTIDGNGTNGETITQGNAIVNGSIGVGTLSPGAKIDIKGNGDLLQFDTDREWKFHTNGTSGASTALYLSSLVDSKDFIIDHNGGVRTARFFARDTASATRVYLCEAGGRVGIGNTAPAYELDVTGTGRFTGNLTVGGNLTISGTTTTVNTTNIIVEDSLIQLASANAADAVDIGMYGKYVSGGTTYYTGLVRDASVSGWHLFTSLSAPGSTSVSNLSYSPLTTAALTCTTINASGNITGTLATAAQSNITSVGNLTSLYSTGDITTFGEGNNIILRSDNNDVDDNNSILFQNSGGAHTWRIGRRYNTSNGQGSNTASLVISGASGQTDYANLTDVMCFHSAGNVGIGDMNPTYKLDVTGDINLTGSLRINGVAQTFGGGGGSSVWTEASSVATYTGKINVTNGSNLSVPAVGTNGGTGQRIVLYPGTSTAVPYGFGMNTSTLWYSSPGTHKFYVGTSEVASISSTGLAATLTTVAQPNITSVGTLTGLNANGNIYFSTAIGVGINSFNTSGRGIRIHGTNTNNPSYLHMTHVDTGSGSTDGFKQYVEDTGLQVYFRNYENGDMYYYTNNAKRMTIGASGGITVGNGSAAGQSSFQLANTTHNGDGFVQTPWIYTAGIENISEKGASGTGMFFGTSATVSADDVISFATNGTNRVQIDDDGMDVTGAIVATGNISGFGTISDKNLKENVETLENSLETVMKMRPVSFKWKEGINNERAGTQDDGFIAQEMEEVIPTVVEEIKGSWWSGQSTYKKINYHKLTTYLAGGMQEQQKEIEALKEENTTLKTQLQSILERLSELESLN